MLYVYMHNYRGFTRTLVPIRPCTFLVGENSTGKSSFLRALQLVSEGGFWFRPSFDRDEDGEGGTFLDFVSATGPEKPIFELGTVNTERQKDGTFKVEVFINRFKNQAGIPALAAHFRITSQRQILIVCDKKRQKYWLTESKEVFQTEKEAVDFALERICEFDVESDLKVLPEPLDGNTPLPISISVIRNIEAGKGPKPNEFSMSIPIRNSLQWIAPIRARPKRIYAGVSRIYSAEGEHSPYLLKANLKSTKFAQKLSEFGRTSGLFATVGTQTFGKGERNPFEVVIKIPGADLSLYNVGYGVSQVLPLVIEFLAQSRPDTFAVQQPEVHLHPRAQAALGGLLLSAVTELKHSFIIETHSDYLIDRFRLELSKLKSPPDAQVIFFQRGEAGNQVTLLPIATSGKYPKEQPKAFREFFINEELRLLSI
jgi:hypothetical protein